MFMGKLIRLLRVIFCEFLKNEEVVLESCEFVLEFDDVFILEKKGSKKVV